MITTEAWVLSEGPPEDTKQVGRKGEKPPARVRGELVLEPFAFDDPKEHEILVEPIYGCWQGNMEHAIDRSPIDICRARGEPKVVIGNSGIARVVRVGSAVKGIREGDLGIPGDCVLDEFDYMVGAYGYDAPNTIGMLAKQTKVKEFYKLPDRSKYSLQQWAAWSLRYPTAWSNWQVALGALRLQLNEKQLPVPHVWGWGGGSTFAELDLARLQGCDATMISGSHVEEIAARGIRALDRHGLGIIDFDERRFAMDEEYRKQYTAGEKAMLGQVKSITKRGVSIFVDYIGSAVYRMTMKALARQGVIATAGWKLGMLTPVNRAVECIARHVHVFTHFANVEEMYPAMAFAEERGWMPEGEIPLYAWEDIPKLVEDFRENRIASYFPLFAVNPA